MNRLLHLLPLLLTSAACALLLLHGPIVQPPDYHHFADDSTLFGVPHAADVVSNIGFALVGLWGWFKLYPARRHRALQAAWPGYALFLTGLTLTAFGSSFYHLAPDDWRLVWDRLPIALACAGLLAGGRADTRTGADAVRDSALLSLFALASVAWWHFTGQHGQGDLRPYLLLQALPLVLIPLWQAIHGAPRGDRACFGVAILLYVLAKAAEVYDHELLAALGWISGHTLKHMLATAAAATLVARLGRRSREPSARCGTPTAHRGYPDATPGTSLG